MGTTEFPKLSRQELERLAADCWHQPSVQRRIPVNIEFIAQQICDASIESLHGLHGFGGEAIVCRSRRGGRRKFTILVDQSLIDGALEAKYRMAVAEEVGHLLAHDTLLASVKTVEDFRELHRRPDWLQLEKDAAHLGRALVLPSEPFLKEAATAYRIAVDDHGFGSPTKVTNQVATLLADRFKAPFPDVLRRLSECPLGIDQRIQRSLAVADQRLLPLTASVSVDERTVRGKTQQLTLEY